MAEWFDSLDDELKGHVSAQNWTTLSADQAAAAAVKAHVTALKTTPTLPSNAVVIPSDAQDAGWEKVYRALGVPADPKEYKFEGVEESEQEQFRSLASKLHLSPAAAQIMVTEMSAYAESLERHETAENTAARNEQTAKLQVLWKGSFDHNKMIAERARGILGLSPDAFEAVANTVGYDTLMAQLHQVGVRLGEAPFDQGHNPGNSLGSPLERKEELMADEGWVKKYLAGDRAAAAEMAAVSRAIVAQRMAR